MTKILWTPHQQLAITTADGDILLAAAAGAGKTAVLAQRCVNLLAAGCNVEELLVLTYTESAALEMRRRIALALRDQLAQKRNNQHLRRQLALLGRAQISTVHAFCRSVLREFFYRAPVDPQFDILDADEAALLKSQIAGELFERYYDQLNQSSADKLFMHLIRSYSSKLDDEHLVHRLVQLHNFLDTLSDYQRWRSRWSEQLDLFQNDHIESLQLIRRRRDWLTRKFDRIINRLHYCRALLEKMSHTEPYRRHVQDDLLAPLEQLADALRSGSPDALDQLNAFSEIGFKRLPNLPRNIDKKPIEPAKDMINQAKDDFKSLAALAAVPNADIAAQLVATSPTVNLMIEMQTQFNHQYAQAKRRLNALDFADLEHKCLHLLLDPDTPETPSDIALELRRRFRYLLVDEYQDISPLQEQMLKLISRSGPAAIGNCFMVGDVKQSIFGFRQADHRIILEKTKSFTPLTPSSDKSLTDGTRPVRIDLNTNFRSRRSVITAVNDLFKRCMTADFADIEYDQNAQLSFGADYYNESDDPPIELHLIERFIESDNEQQEEESEDDIAQLDATRREAAIVARRIRQMVGAAENTQPEFNILDPETKTQRPVRYSDIVILLRSMKFNSRIWTEVFQQMHIPVHAEQSTGYFVATEVQDMMSLLALLDNTRQDIPLAAVLRSPLVGLSESQLSAVRLHSPDTDYHDALQHYTETGPDEALRKTLIAFFEQLNTWRELARQIPLAELIWTIYRQTHLLSFARGMPQGRRRYQNLLHLYDRARQFDTFARRGLARFLRFIEDLRDQQGDFGPAPVLTAADNVVRIMSIHKSKGLEFPVVIVADLAKPFNFMDQKSDILFNRDGELPIGLKIIDTYTRDKWSTLAHQLIADQSKQRQLAEELRILYVALTRAREKLILTATIGLDNARNHWNLWRNRSELALPEFQLAQAKSPIDWIGPALADTPDLAAFFGEKVPSPTDIKMSLTTYNHDGINDAIQAGDLKSQDTTNPNWRKALEESTIENPSPAVQQVMDRLDWRYAFENIVDLPARQSVSELKRAIDVDRDDAFSPDASVLDPHAPLADPLAGAPVYSAGHDHTITTAADIGVWTHLLLQRLNLASSLSASGLTEQLNALIEKGLFTVDQAQQINLAAVAHFFHEPLGRSMIDHRDRLHREWPFTLALPACDIYPHISLADHEKQERVLIRGMIDCWFETDKGITIVDYKTDRISADQCPDRAERYRIQMQLYRRALESILSQNVDQGVIYFLVPGLGFSIFNGR